MKSNASASLCTKASILVGVHMLYLAALLLKFQGALMYLVSDVAKPFMVERVEGDDQLSSCLGAN